MFRKVIYLMKKYCMCNDKKKCFYFLNDGRKKSELRNVFLCLSLCAILLRGKLKKHHNIQKKKYFFFGDVGGEKRQSLRGREWWNLQVDWNSYYGWIVIKNLMLALNEKHFSLIWIETFDASSEDVLGMILFDKTRGEFHELCRKFSTKFISFW